MISLWVSISTFLKDFLSISISIFFRIALSIYFSELPYQHFSELPYQYFSELPYQYFSELPCRYRYFQKWPCRYWYRYFSEVLMCRQSIFDIDISNRASDHPLISRTNSFRDINRCEGVGESAGEPDEEDSREKGSEKGKWSCEEDEKPAETGNDGAEEKATTSAETLGGESAEDASNETPKTGRRPDPWLLFQSQTQWSS